MPLPPLLGLKLYTITWLVQLEPSKVAEITRGLLALLRVGTPVIQDKRVWLYSCNVLACGHLCMLRK